MGFNSVFFQKLIKQRYIKLFYFFVLFFISYCIPLFHFSAFNAQEINYFSTIPYKQLYFTKQINIFEHNSYI